MKYILYKCNWLLALLLLVSGLAMAAVESPVITLNQVANQMINQLNSHKTTLKSSNSKQFINQIVDQILIPYIDTDRMSAAVVGRQYWLLATPAQKQTFIQEFKKLVTSTYAAALASYNDDKVVFYPLRGNYNSANTLLVRSVIIRKNGQRIAIDYNVVRTGPRWKVYDFSIDNISMVQSYRSQFAGVLSSGGMNSLLARLQAHNRQS